VPAVSYIDKLSTNIKRWSAKTFHVLMIRQKGIAIFLGTDLNVNEVLLTAVVLLVFVIK
jgi:hypothetical protein